MKNYIWTEYKGLTLENIFNSVNEYSFLVGSGISLDLPSGLPTGFQITRTLLEKLIPQELKQDILELMNPNRLNMENEGDFVRFEQLMEYLQKFYDKDLKFLDFLKTCDQPNHNHYFMAKMIQKNCDVFTTNYDSLIEYALINLNIPNSSISPIIEESDINNPDKKDGYKVYKLHGSFLDLFDNSDRKQSIQATLSKITNSAGKEFQVPQWKRKILQNSLEKKDLVIIGYSGLDDFDILPSICSIFSEKRVIWINHDSNCEDPLIEKLSSNLNLNEKRNDIRSYGNLEKFANYDVRKPHQLIHITINTKTLISILFQSLAKDQIEKYQQKLSQKKIEFNLSTLNIPNCARWWLAGQILMDHNLWSKSLSVLEQALNYAKKEHNDLGISDCLNSLGIFYLKKGSWKNAIDCFIQGLENSTKMGNSEAIFASSLQLGTAYSNIANWDGAQKMYFEALSIGDHLDRMDAKPTLFMLMGSLYAKMGDFNKAIGFFEKAFEIYEQIGDLHGKAIGYCNIGIIFEMRGNPLAWDYFQKALKLYEQLGDLNSKAEILDNIGQYLHRFPSENRVNQNEVWYYSQALMIAEKIENNYLKINCLNNLGTYYFQLNDMNLSDSFYQQALAIADNLNNLRKKAMILNNMGMNSYSKRDNRTAYSKFSEAMNIANQLDLKESKKIYLLNLGNALDGLGNPQEAKKKYIEALQIAETLKMPLEKISVLKDFGLFLANHNEFQNGIQYLHQAQQILEELQLINMDYLQVMINLGIAYDGRTDLENASQSYETALRIAEMLRNPYKKCIILYNLGALYSKTSNRERMKNYFQDALKVATEYRIFNLKSQIEEILSRF